MKPFSMPLASACCGLSRRHFLEAGCATCAGALGAWAAPRLLAADPDAGQVRIRIIYSLHAPQQPGPDWPNKGFDFVPVMDRINGELAKGCPGFEFATSMAQGPEQAKKILEEDKAGAIDGYLVYQMNCWNRVVQTFAASGKPVLYADFQFAGSGGFLVCTAGFLRRKATKRPPSSRWPTRWAGRSCRRRSGQRHKPAHGPSPRACSTERAGGRRRRHGFSLAWSS
jgi:hypothetical protein